MRGRGPVTMNTQSNNPRESLELRIRQLRVLWLALLGSLAGFFGLTLFTGPPEIAEPNNTVLLIFVAIGLTTTLVSFFVKKRFFDRAVEQQQVELVQQGLVVAGMLTEVAAMLGMVEYFRTGNPYYYVLFIIAACGQLLHFPRREPVFNASFREKADSTVGYGL